MSTVRNMAIESDHTGDKGFSREKTLHSDWFRERLGSSRARFREGGESRPQYGLGRRRPGILICGSGAWMRITTNKVPDVFDALCFDAFSADCARTGNRHPLELAARYGKRGST